jgi:hypothetical protein
MTVDAGNRRVAFRGDEHFYRRMGIFLALLVVAGFGFNVGGGWVSLAEFPVLIFVHATVFMLWIGLFIVQPTLIGRNNIALHRRVGWVGVAIALLMVWLGWEASIDMMRRRSDFRDGVTLSIQMSTMVMFALLVFTAIVLRRRSDWHRRLMLCATIILAAPAVARLMPLWLGPFTLLAILSLLVGVMAVGLAHDRRRFGRFHPAYWWGIAILVLGTGAMIPVGLSAPVQGYVKAIEWR